MLTVDSFFLEAGVRLLILSPERSHRKTNEVATARRLMKKHRKVSIAGLYLIIKLWVKSLWQLINGTHLSGKKRGASSECQLSRHERGRRNAV